MSLDPRLIVLGEKLAAIAVDIEQGKFSDAFAVSEQIIGFLADAIPTERLKDFLDASDRKFIDLATDVEEDIKLETEK